MRIWLYAVASIGLHFVIWALVQMTPEFPRESKAVEVNFEPSLATYTQVEVPAEKQVKLTDDKIKFLAEKTVRVKEQLRALKLGLTKNRSQEVASKPVPTPQTGEDIADGGSGPGLKVKAVDVSEMARKDLFAERGVSTLADTLPDTLSLGEITIMNSDPGLYYTFFNRLRENTYPRWDGRLRSVIHKVPMQVFNSSITKKWTTNLEIWLKKNGEFDSAHVMKSSGVPEFDEAAAWAFRDTRIYPNPPQGLVEDGMIKLRFALTVNADPKVLMRQ